MSPGRPVGPSGAGEAWIVVDLGFGDAGKGTITDFLVRERGASLVVRFNGGAQAGHNVVLADGRHHTFAQLGAGTFVPGVGTHLGPAFLLHPGGLLVEADHLARKGVPDALERLTVDGRARVITPFQQAAGRLRELLRGARAHGTCGVGIGECAGDADRDDALVAADLRDPDRLRERLRRQQERKRAELDARGLDDPRAAAENALLDDPRAVDRTLHAWGPARDLRVLDPQAAHARVREASSIVLEGAQGVLLDETWGFHPHTTWSDCTPRGARALLAEAGTGEAAGRAVTTLGVTRAYMVRHGPGPFPTEGTFPVRELAGTFPIREQAGTFPIREQAGTFPIREQAGTFPVRELAGTLTVPEPHNDATGWQGQFRTGALDLVLLRYAAGACDGLDGVAITCLDRIPARVPVRGPDGLREVDAAELPALVADAVGAPILVESRGPTAEDKRAAAAAAAPRYP